MSDRSLDQYRNGHQRSGPNTKLRWVGQFYVYVSGPTGSKLIGTWWHKQRADDWAREYMRVYPMLHAFVIELEFKDFYLARKVEDVVKSI